MDKSNKLLNKLIIGLTGMVCFALLNPPSWRCEAVEGLNSGVQCLWDTHHSPEDTLWNRNLITLNSKQARLSSTSRSTASSRPLFDTITIQAARAHGIDANLIRAVIKVESNYKPRAVSPAGAGGLMQLTASTARHLGVIDRFNPHQNIYGGTRYLKQLLKEFDGNMELALAAYNAGPFAVRRHGGIPPYKQTQDYVRKVMHAYRAMSSQQMA